MKALIKPDAYEVYEKTKNDAYAELEKKIASVWAAYNNMQAGVCKELSAKEWTAHIESALRANGN